MNKEEWDNLVGIGFVEKSSGINYELKYLNPEDFDKIKINDVVSIPAFYTVKFNEILTYPQSCLGLLKYNFIEEIKE